MKLLTQEKIKQNPEHFILLKIDREKRIDANKELNHAMDMVKKLSRELRR